MKDKEDNLGYFERIRFVISTGIGILFFGHILSLVLSEWIDWIDLSTRFLVLLGLSTILSLFGFFFKSVRIITITIFSIFCFGCLLLLVVGVSIGTYIDIKDHIEETQASWEAQDRVLEVLDDGTERTYSDLRHDTLLPDDQLKQALYRLEKKKRIGHNRKPIYSRKFYIMR